MKYTKTRECLIYNDEWLVNKGKVPKEFFNNKRKYLYIILNRRCRVKVSVYMMDSTGHNCAYAQNIKGK